MLAEFFISIFAYMSIHISTNDQNIIFSNVPDKRR